MELNTTGPHESIPPTPSLNPVLHWKGYFKYLHLQIVCTKQAPQGSKNKSAPIGIVYLAQEKPGRRILDHGTLQVKASIANENDLQLRKGLEKWCRMSMDVWFGISKIRLQDHSSFMIEQDINQHMLSRQLKKISQRLRLTTRWQICLIQRSLAQRWKYVRSRLKYSGVSCDPCVDGWFKPSWP